jgi:rhodanese-related sulfurtransferase
MAHSADRHAVQRMLAAETRLVDVLPAKEYEAEHIAGAINIPLKAFGPDLVRRLDLDRERPVIVYCHDYQ